MSKIIKFTSDNSELTEKAYQIRTVVFVEEQGVDKQIEYDGQDNNAVHYLLFVDDRAVATARKRITEEGIKLERLAVLKDHRGKGFGGELMEFMMNDILPTDKKIYLNSQADVIDIYKRYGFRIVGTMFLEANIEHYKMVYTP